jgi:hypothetical protein
MRYVDVEPSRAGSEATRGQRAGEVRSRGPRKGISGLESGVLRKKWAAGGAVIDNSRNSVLRTALPRS